ncbi:hypothetical protein [Anaerospora sp.]|jgi:hypothetical protein|uniref:hypothetical protein n=1 Tax=Anaerospora sp. TaxID=1960278 RepID=UPI00289C82D4|nr:hypothetical protein [Anaerospora sp.]MDF2929779.1 hypothetical protein [Anaerospora sp.]
MPTIEEPLEINTTIPAGPRINRGQRMRERAIDTGSDGTLLGLEQVFEAKLAAIRTYEQRLTTVTDPYARKALQQLIHKERKELLHLAELTDMVEQSPETTSFARSRRRLRHEVKARTGHDLTFWLGLAVVGAVLLPSVREKLRPLAVKAVQGVIGLTEHTQGLFSGVREDIEDLVSEAQFERFKDSIEDELDDELPPSCEANENSIRPDLA